MSTTVLGKVSMMPKGAWNASTSYEPLDVVSYGGSAFLARRANSNVTPIEGADWQMIAEKATVGNIAQTTGYSEKDVMSQKAVTNAIGYVTPKMFGAKGDGVTDDTGAIRSCLNYASTNKYEYIQFDKGSYLISDTIIIRDHIGIIGTYPTKIFSNTSLEALIKYDTNVLRYDKELTIKNLLLDGSNKVNNGILFDSESRVFYQNALISNIVEDNFLSHGISFNHKEDSALYASVIENCVFYSGLKLDKFGDTVTVRNCLFGNKSDNEFVQYTNATTFNFSNNNVTGYCLFNLQINPIFSNNIFECQKSLKKDLIRFITANEIITLVNCVFSYNVDDQYVSDFKIAYFDQRFLTFIGCSFTNKNAPSCYGAPKSLATKLYGCMVGNGLNNITGVLSSFNGLMFDVYDSVNGATGGFNIVNTDFVNTNKLKLNGFISIKSFYSEPAELEDNTLYIITESKKLVLSLTQGVVYETTLSYRA